MSAMNREDQIRVGLQVVETSSVDEAIGQLEELWRASLKVDEEVKQGTQALKQHADAQREDTAATVANTTEQAELSRTVDTSSRAVMAAAQATRELKKEKDAAARASAELGRGVLQTSYMVQDFTSVLAGGGGLTRAIGAVQNNIPMLLANLGMSGGLAGTISLVSVGLGAAIPLMMQFAGASDDAAESAKKAADELERLRSSPTLKERQGTELVGGYIKDIGADQIAKAIEETMLAEEQAKALATAQRIAEREMIPGTEASAARILQRGGRRLDVDAAVRNTMRERTPGIIGEANNLFTQMTKGNPDAMRRVAGMAGWGSGFFPKDFDADLLSLTPEADRAANEDEAATEAFGERAKAAGERKRQAARDQRMKRARVERNLEKRTQEDLQNEDSLKQEEERQYQDGMRAAEQARQAAAEKAREDDRAKREAERKAREDAKANDPTNVMQRDAAALQDRLATESMRQGRDVGANPFEVQAIAREAAGNLPAVGGDIAEAVRMAVQQVYAKVQADLQAQAQEIMGMGADVSSMMPGYPPYMRRVR